MRFRTIIRHSLREWHSRVPSVYVTAFVALSLFACRERGASLARVGSFEVTPTDLRILFSNITPSQRSYYESLEGRKQLLDSAILRKVIVAAAERDHFSDPSQYKNLTFQQESKLIEAYVGYIKAANCKVTTDEIHQFLMNSPKSSSVDLNGLEAIRTSLEMKKYSSWLKTQKESVQISINESRLDTIDLNRIESPNENPRASQGSAP